jgi:hypothetical protein
MRLEGEGVVAATNTPQDFAALIRKDFVLWRKVVKDANIKPDAITASLYTRCRAPTGMMALDRPVR